MGLLFEGPRYVIDTSSLIDLHRWYRPAVAEGVWTKLDELIDSGIAASVEDVFEELAVQEDALLDWAESRRGFFRPLEPDIQAAAKQVLSEHSRLKSSSYTDSGPDRRGHRDRRGDLDALRQAPHKG